MNEIWLSCTVVIMLLLLMQNHTLLTIMWQKSKPEVEFQHDSRWFSKAEHLRNFIHQANMIDNM